MGWGIWAIVRMMMQLMRALPELIWAIIFVVWVGAGTFAGLLAITAHTIGILGRLFGEVYDEVEPNPVMVLETAGVGLIGRWAYGVVPQVAPRLLSYTFFRFEVNVRATAMVGFVGAGGIGDAIHDAITFFHYNDLATLLLVLLITVVAVDALGHIVRKRVMSA